MGCTSSQEQLSCSNEKETIKEESKEHCSVNAEVCIEHKASINDPRAKDKYKAVTNANTKEDSNSVNVVPWLYETECGFLLCDDKMSKEIEEAYQSNQVLYKLYKNNKGYEIDFMHMTLTDLSTGKVQTIKRNVLKINSTPKIKELPPLGSTEIVLSDKTFEHEEVKRLFDETMYGHYTSLKITKIINLYLKHFYNQKLQYISNEHKAKPKNMIKMLFHGTKRTDPKVIYDGTEGFNPKYSSKGVWGRGIYFSSSASFSCKRYAHSNRDVILACVITGKCYDYDTETNDNLIKPPNGYDSVRGYALNTDVFIIYDLYMAYPEYLLSFT